jgi:signal transduction histidine kinase
MKGEVRIRFNIIVRSVTMVFFMLIFTMLLLALIAGVLVRTGIIDTPFSITLPLVAMAVVSIIIGTVCSVATVPLVLRPMSKLVDATREIAAGNFDVHIEFRGTPAISELTASFNAMARELRNIEIMRSDFVRNVSHEFRTPLQSIRGFAKLLKKDGMTPEKRREYLDIIIHEAERLGLLAGNILLLSKVEGQEILTDQKEFSLDEELRRVIRLFEATWEKKGLSLSADLAPVTCTGSEELLSEVWINLLANAVKFTPEGGAITVTAGQADDAAVVTVADTGCGMTAEALRHIFDKFYQGDSSHSAEGNGLGLALVRRIVELHRGRVEVSSAPGRGTRVTVLLPAVQSPISASFSKQEYPSLSGQKKF